MAAQHANAKKLMSLYEDLFQQRFGRKPLLNSYKDMWSFKAIENDFGFKEAERIIRHYFSLNKVQTLKDLMNHYHLIYQRMIEREEDNNNLRLLAKETERRVLDFEHRNRSISINLPD